MFCFVSIDDGVDQGTVLPAPDVPEQGRRDRSHGNDLWALAVRGVNIRTPVTVWGRVHSGEPLRRKCLWPASAFALIYISLFMEGDFFFFNGKQSFKEFVNFCEIHFQ